MRTVKCVGFKLVCACAWCVWLALASCEGLAPSGEVGRVDSLNGEAYAWRYRDLDSSRVAARRAFEEARFYRSGKAEACNNLAFCAFMEMDFKKAEALYRSVYELTKNELELLVADVGLMRLYQRTALNKEFYDYRNSALRRMSRIAEDDALFAEGRGRKRLGYARSEFYIVSAVYYYYLQQRPEALENIRRVSDEGMADTAQWLYAHYVRGAASLVEEREPKGRSCATSMSSSPRGGWPCRRIFPISKAAACRRWPT